MYNNELKIEANLEKAWQSMAEGQEIIPGLNPMDGVGDQPEEKLIINKVNALIKHYLFYENSYEVDRRITSVLERRIERRQSLVDNPHMILGNLWHTLKEQVLQYIEESDPTLISAMNKIEKYADLEDLTDFDDILKAKVTEIIKNKFPEQLSSDGLI